MIVPDVSLRMGDVRNIQWLLCEASENCSENCVLCLYSKHNIEDFNATLLSGATTTLEVPVREDSNVYTQIREVLCWSARCALLPCRQCVYNEENLEEFIQIIKGE